MDSNSVGPIVADALYGVPQLRCRAADATAIYDEALLAGVDAPPTAA